LKRKELKPSRHLNPNKSFCKHEVLSTSHSRNKSFKGGRWDATVLYANGRMVVYDTDDCKEKKKKTFTNASPITAAFMYLSLLHTFYLNLILFAIEDNIAEQIPSLWVMQTAVSQLIAFRRRKSPVTMAK